MRLFPAVCHFLPLHPQHETPTSTSIQNNQHIYSFPARVHKFSKKSRSHLQFAPIRRATWHKFHIENPQFLIHLWTSFILALYARCMCSDMNFCTWRKTPHKLCWKYEELPYKIQSPGRIDSWNPRDRITSLRAANVHLTNIFLFYYYVILLLVLMIIGVLYDFFVIPDVHVLTVRWRLSDQSKQVTNYNNTVI
jgi:hypothetical protein